MDHMVVVFNYFRNLRPVFHSDYTNLHSHQKCEAHKFPLSTVLPTIFIFLSFDNSHSKRGEMISYSGFDLHFSDD